MSGGGGEEFVGCGGFSVVEKSTQEMAQCKWADRVMNEEILMVIKQKTKVGYQRMRLEVI